MIRKLALAGILMGFIMSADAATYIVDVRTPEEISQTGKVQGALADDFKSPAFLREFAKFNINPAKDEVLVYCRSGKRAGMAKAELEKLGYKNVKNLGGYEDAAKTLNKPLVK